MQSHERVIELRGVTKDYHGLRPLRVEHLALRQGQTAALLGLDRVAAEVLVNLITAATLPDSGDVEIFGSLTRDITDADAWFRALDHFGIFSERVVLVDELNVEQNLALPFSLVVDDMPQDLRSQVRKIADEVGILATELSGPMASAGASVRTRTRLGKALALAPRVLLAEHPNAAVPPDEVARLGADLSAIAARRGLTMLVLTADTTFAGAACNQVWTLRAATGKVAQSSGWSSWFTRGTR